MSDETYQSTREEWQSATDKSRAARKETETEAGAKALAECREMLNESTHGLVSRVTKRCEHDYEPAPLFFGTLQCIHCGCLVEAPKPEQSPTRPDQPPVESYWL